MSGQQVQTAPQAPPAHAGQWANPAPAGLVALAIACFCFFALLTGKVQPSATPILAGWLIGGFVVQFVVGLIELREGATTAGNIFLFFSAYFMLAGGLKYLIRAYLPEAHTAKGAMEVDHSMDGWAWLVLAIILILWTPAYLKRSGKMLTMVVIALDVGVPIIALRDLGILPSATWSPIAGWAILISGIFGIYVASAIILNEAFGKTVMPMPGPFLK